MRVYIPFEPDDPKTRLSPVLGDDERVELGFAMLGDVYAAVDATRHSPVVLSTRELGARELEERGMRNDVEVEVSSLDLTPAVNAVLDSVEPPVAVVMSDLALATPGSVESLVETSGDVAIAPGRRGGTNAFVSRTERFEVDYHGASFLDHLGIARSRGLEVGTVDSFRLSTDVDEPDDLVEVMVHAEGEARDYVEKRFEIVEDDGVRVVRN